MEKERQNFCYKALPQTPLYDYQPLGSHTEFFEAFAIVEIQCIRVCVYLF
jgi:hypothetical protein